MTLIQELRALVDTSSACRHCLGARAVGWSSAGPILCPECSRGEDPFTVITEAWREQRTKIRELEAILSRAESVEPTAWELERIAIALAAAMDQATPWEELSEPVRARYRRAAKAARAESREQVARARLAPGSPEHAALWEAINAYVAACNGRLDSTSVARQCAVVTIEGAIEDAIAAAERNER